MTINWKELFAERTRDSERAELGNLLGFGSVSGLISLAGGFPAPELFPVDAFREAFDAVMASDSGAALQYGISEGFAPLREFLAERMSGSGASVSIENVVITTGSQQGLDLVARLLVDPGSPVVVEDPSYSGGLDALRASQARFIAIPSDEEGMRVDILEESLPRITPAPRLIYVLPNFQNPSGGTLSLERRHRLLELSFRHGIPILEDDPYGELRYEGEHLPSLKSMDTLGNVIYLGTFSKILAPGLRLGWVAAPPELVRPLVRLKQTADLHSSTLSQRLTYEVCRAGLLERHVERVRPIYRERRDLMLRALASTLPAGARCSRPEGGLFLWVSLSGGVDTGAMLADALREGVAYVPGAAFQPLGGRTSSMRLNFSGVAPGQIEEGITRLSRVIAKRCIQPPPSTARAAA